MICNPHFKGGVAHPSKGNKQIYARCSTKESKTAQGIVGDRVKRHKCKAGFLVAYKKSCRDCDGSRRGEKAQERKRSVEKLMSLRW